MNQQTTNRDTGEAAAANAPANSATSTSTPDNQPTPLDAFEVTAHHRYVRRRPLSCR